MADATLRLLERRWLASGTAEDGHRYVDALLRSGTLQTHRLDLLATLHHPLVCERLDLPYTPARTWEDLRDWVASFAAWDPRLVVHALLAAQGPDPDPNCALARRWLDDPEDLTDLSAALQLVGDIFDPALRGRPAEAPLRAARDLLQTTLHAEACIQQPDSPLRLTLLRSACDGCLREVQLGGAPLTRVRRWIREAVTAVALAFDLTPHTDPQDPTRRRWLRSLARGVIPTR